MFQSLKRIELKTFAILLVTNVSYNEPTNQLQRSFLNERKSDGCDAEILQGNVCACFDFADRRDIDCRWECVYKCPLA